MDTSCFQPQRPWWLQLWTFVQVLLATDYTQKEEAYGQKNH